MIKKILAISKKTFLFRKSRIVQLIFMTNLVIILSIILSLRDLNNTIQVNRDLNYKIGVAEEVKILSIIKKNILRGFTREFNQYNMKKENFHSLQISEKEGEMVFFYGEEFFISELTEEQVEKILDIAINERYPIKVNELGGFK